MCTSALGMTCTTVGAKLIKRRLEAAISVVSRIAHLFFPFASWRCHKQVCREADGFQRSLVSPEFGLRRLVHDSVATVLDPVDLTVRRVHQVLLDASR